MCGIFGLTGAFVRLNPAYSGRAVLWHRGPDAEGVWRDDEVALEHARLSIIDLSPEANQPFSHADRYVLAYNGEIFNFKDLRASLASDTSFTTNSDTEVLIRLLARQGTNALPRLNGMFAFAFYDRLSRKIVLVRDRFGVKPLYYYQDSRGLVFASEQKAIYPIIGGAAIDKDALAEYLAFKFVSGRNTLVEGVHELEPGHVLEYDLVEQRSSTRAWYELPEERDRSTEDLLGDANRLLEDAVRLRLISDVPVGLQLSGGVDSSLVAHAATVTLGKRLNTYSVGFPGDEHDESAFAGAVARKLGLLHCPIEFAADDFLAIWEKATYHNDEPINHPHALPIFKLNQVARRDVTVLLSGEGADEVFLGYEHHRRYLALPSTAAAVRFHQFLPDEVVSRALGERLRRDEWLGCRTEMAASASGQNAHHLLEFRLHLNTLLNRIDKMSMASGMEIRTPFLDYRVVDTGLRERAVNLVGDDGRGRKLPLMKMYEQRLGDGGSSRAKIGFRVPFDEWMKNRKQFRQRVTDYVADIETTGLLSRSYVRDLVDRLTRGALTPGIFKEAWVVANLAIWRRVFAEVRAA